MVSQLPMGEAVRGEAIDDAGQGRPPELVVEAGTNDALRQRVSRMSPTFLRTCAQISGT